MTNLIDERYFWGSLNIPNLTQNRIGVAQMQTVASVNVDIQRYIAVYQKQYLLEMLGETLAATITEEKALALFVDEALLLSPLANYVFFHYMRDNASANTPTGEKKMSVANAINISSSGRIANAWNKMVALNISVSNVIINDDSIDKIVIQNDYDNLCPEAKISADNLFIYTNEFGI